jgi:hypothetical protein
VKFVFLTKKKNLSTLITSTALSVLKRALKKLLFIQGKQNEYEECFKKSFTMVFKLLLCGERYNAFTRKGVQTIYRSSC